MSKEGDRPVRGPRAGFRIHTELEVKRVSVLNFPPLESLFPRH